MIAPNDLTPPLALDTQLLYDDFSGPSLDLNKWTLGSHAGNLSAVANGTLRLRSSNSTSAWVHTRDRFSGRNKTIQLKVIQPNNDGALGMSPTVTTSSANGFYQEPAWYRFYNYRSGDSGPHMLFVQWKRNGVVEGLNVATGVNFTSNFYLRIRTNDTEIFFEYSFDGAAWATAHSEAFTLTGYTLDSSYAFELSAYNTPSRGEWAVDDFAINANAEPPPADTTPPVISSVAPGSITASSATIAWRTDEPSDAQVEFGLTTSYGSQSSLNVNLATAHGVTLEGLGASTTYHYRVKSRDAAGNLAVSGDFSFATTPANQAIFFDHFTGSSLNGSKWNAGTNSDNQTRVSNDELELRSSGSQSGWIITKPAFTARNTIVAVKIVQPNNDGDLGMSPTYNLSSSNGIYSQSNWYRFYTYRNQSSGPYLLFVQWKKSGAVGGLDVTGNLSISGVIYLRLRMDDADVHFEVSLNNQQWQEVYRETFALPGFTLDSAFYYEIAAARTSTKGVLIVDDFSITTPTEGNIAFANVQGIFARNCVRCHQGTQAPADLILVAGQSHQQVVNVSSTEYPQWLRVHPGQRSLSWLYEKISNPNPPVGSKMENLSPDEIGLIGKWIDQGATAVPASPYADLQFRTTALPLAEINVAFSVELVIWGGLPGYQFDLVAGALPPGMALDAAAGTIVGVPTTSGQFAFTVRVRDQQTPAATRDHSFLLDVRNSQAHWQVASDLEIAPVVSDLHLPVNIAFVPGGGQNPNDPLFYVTLLYGDIVMVQRDFQKQLYATHLLNFNPTGAFPGSGEMGVTGITVDPGSGDVFASMVYDSLGSKYGKVVRFHSNDGGRSAAAKNVILAGIPAGVSHQIQAVTIGPDGKLYVNVGDGWQAAAAPNVNDLRGKVLRLNLDGSIPPDNPFPNNRVYATGVRNPFGAAWRPEDGKLYVSDNGPNSDDRLLKVNAGGDYGWGLNFDLTKGAIHLWNPTVAPVAMDFLRDTPFPSSYQGQLFVGWSGPTFQLGQTSRGKKIQAFKLDANGEVQSHSSLLDYVGVGYATVVGVAFGPDGLYFTDLYGENGFDQLGQTRGNVYRIKWIGGDATPPVISNVAAQNILATTARIAWNTNEASDSQVEYGLTAAYGNSSALDNSLVTNHAVDLAGLSANTTYHFRVRSRDTAGDLATSNDFSFTTSGTGNTILFADDFNSGTLDLNKWTKGGDSGNQASVANQELVLHSAGTQSGWVVTRQAYAARHTTITVKVAQPNDDGDLGMSPTYSLTGLNGVYAEPNWYRFYTYRDQAGGPYRLYAMWSKNGVVGGMDVTGSLNVAAAVYLRLRLDDTEVHFEASLDNTVWREAYHEPFDLPGYTLDSAFYYELAAYRSSVNGALIVDDFAIATHGPALVTGSKEEPVAAQTLPTAFGLSPNYPNPFHFNTQLQLALPQAARVHAVIFDVTGREVRQLDLAQMPAGYHSMNWEGTNMAGQHLSSGVYFLRVNFETPAGRREVLTRQLRLIR